MSKGQGTRDKEQGIRNKEQETIDKGKQLEGDNGGAGNMVCYISFPSRRPLIRHTGIELSILCQEAINFVPWGIGKEGLHGPENRLLTSCHIKQSPPQVELYMNENIGLFIPERLGQLCRVIDSPRENGL